jgi:hypothetical protein
MFVFFMGAFAIGYAHKDINISEKNNLPALSANPPSGTLQNDGYLTNPYCATRTSLSGNGGGVC